jgi:uncharacterized membrane protein
MSSIIFPYEKERKCVVVSFPFLKKWRHFVTVCLIGLFFSVCVIWLRCDVVVDQLWRNHLHRMLGRTP